MTFISKNPYNHSINLILNEDSEEVVQLKISNAQTVSNEWKFSDLSTRSEILKKLSNILIDRKKELAELITKEIGQPIKQSINEIEKCALTAQYYAANTEKFLKDEYVQTDALESYISYEPLGIILGIVSWNFPFWMAFRFIIPTISAGNCVLLKHSSNVPMCALAIEDIMTEVGYPKYVFQMLYVKSNHLDNIIADSRINGVSFAGGVYGGSQVAALAGRNIKKTVLELGGSDAFIVLPDADINITSSALIENRFRNAGQACNSPKRVFVHASILEEFLNSLSNKISSLKIGDPLDYETELGPVANEDVLNKLVQQVNDSLQKGAKLVYGGKIYQGGSLFYEPTILSEVKPGMPVFDEEVFGPVISISHYESIDDLLNMVNSSVFGLGASIWTKDINFAKRLINKVYVGNVFINSSVRSDPRLPYGGVKLSGYGRELGYIGIREFTNVKTVVVKSLA